MSQLTDRFVVFAGIVAGLLAVFLFTTPTLAVSGSDWRSGNIINNSVFFNPDTMTTSGIQSFLNARVPSCDTNHARTSSANDSGPPYTCLKNYSENPTTHQNNSDSGGGNPVSGGWSAARIIKHAANTYGVSPKALLVLLQKEQSLVTDDWPWARQYRSATGFGCPDTAPCNAEYYGFYNQVMKAAYQFKRYATYPSSYRYKAFQTNFIQWNPNASCGGSNVYIQNQATAGLYNYTPYQPNAAALANLYGEGNSCSAYGNRNFWRMYNDWFGSTQLNYSGTVTSTEVFSDSARTQELSMPLALLRSDTTIYVTVKIKNDGGKTWNRSFMNLGTVNPHNRNSAFASDGWINSTRPAKMIEESVAPGGTGTFMFSMTTPKADGIYNERFMAVADGITWLSTSAKVEIPITVSNTYNGVVVSKQSFADSGFSQPSRTSIEPETDLYWRVRVKNTGTNTWSNSITRVATIDPNNRPSEFVDDSWISAARPVNLKESSVAPGGTGTFEFKVKAPSDEGIYTEKFGVVVEGVRWMPQPKIEDPYRISDTLDRLFPSEYLVVNTQLQNGSQRRLIMQGDGNLVVYNNAGKAAWNSGTKGGKRLVMQGDGNLVIYNSSNKAIWNSGTKGGKRLVMQGDGNLVIYNSSNKAIWNSGTR